MILNDIKNDVVMIYFYVIFLENVGCRSFIRFLGVKWWLVGFNKWRRIGNFFMIFVRLKIFRFF